MAFPFDSISGGSGGSPFSSGVSGSDEFNFGNQGNVSTGGSKSGFFNWKTAVVAIATAVLTWFFATRE